MICFNCLEECQPAIESGNITKEYQAFFPRCNECKALGTSSFIRKKPQNNKQGTEVNDNRQKLVSSELKENETIQVKSVSKTKMKSIKMSKTKIIKKMITIWWKTLR